MVDSRTTGAASVIKLGSPFVVVILPLAFVIFGVFVPLSSLLHTSRRFGLLLSILLAGSATLLYLIDNGRPRPPAFLSNVRALAATLLLSGLGIWAVAGDPFDSYLRSAELWITVALVTLLFLLRTVLQRGLNVRRFFVQAVLRSVNAPSEASIALQSVAGATREFSVEAGEAASGVTRVRRLLIFFLIWSLGALVVDGWVLHRQNVLLQVGLALTAVAVLFGLTLLGRMDEEQRLLTEGLLPSREGSRLRSLLAGLLFALALLLSLFAASAPPLLSESALRQIMAWLAWLIHLLPSPKPRAYTPPPPPRAPTPHHSPLFDQLKALPAMQGSDLIGRILTYLGWTIAGAAALGVLWLLVAPIFRADYGSEGLRGRLRSMGLYLSRLLANAARWARELIGAFGGFQNPGEGASAEERTTKRRTLPRRRGGLLSSLFGTGGRRFSRAYLRVVRWGEARGVPFSHSDGPREYLERVERKAPESRDLLELIGELYERHLFSPRPLSAEQMSAYFKAIGEVVKHERI